MIETVSAWAQRRPDVRALLLLGSRARRESPADEWSDHDFVVAVDDPAPYLESAAWLDELGRPLLSHVEPAATGGVWERRVLFADGADADFTFVATQRLDAVLRADDVQPVLERGFRVLVDEADLTSGLAPRPGGSVRRPYAELVNEFWYRAIFTARKLRRGELYLAVQGCNCALRAGLADLLAIDAEAAGRDAWHEGRFLERWADPEWAARLPATVAAHDAGAVVDAITAACDLFADVCARLGGHAGVDVGAVRRQLDAVLRPAR